MRNGRSSLSKSRSYRDLGEFWGRKDLAKVWNKTKRTRFAVRIESEVTYCAVEPSLAEKVQLLAKKKGISSDTIINLWIHQKLQERPTRTR